MKARPAELPGTASHLGLRAAAVLIVTLAGATEPVTSETEPAVGSTALQREARPDDDPTRPTDEETLLGRRSGIQIDDNAGQTVFVEAGWPLRQLPDTRSRRLAAIAESVELPLLEERDGWARVEYRGWTGWLRLAGPAPDPPAISAAAETGTGRPAPLPALPGFAPDPARLARLLEMLGAGRTSGSLGPFALHTDVRDAELLARLDRLAAGLPASYRQRFGLDPGALDGETVVFLAREAAYRVYESELLGLAGLDTLGHSGSGLSVIFLGDQSPEQMEQIAIHELTHLLNRRTLGLDIAPWLEEGLAEELGFCRIDPAGRILLGTVGGGTRFEGTLSAGRRATLEVRTTTGPLASLAALLASWKDPRRPPLGEFLAIPAGQFLRPESRQIYYAQSALFVRFLLDGRKGRLAPSFRSFLQQVARGGAADGDTLWRHLEADPAKLDEAFYAWVRSCASSHGIVVSSRR